MLSLILFIINNSDNCAQQMLWAVRDGESGCFSWYQFTPTERMVPELIPVLGSQPTGDVSYKPGGRLSLLSTRPAVTPTTLKSDAANFSAW